MPSSRGDLSRRDAVALALGAAAAAALGYRPARGAARSADGTLIQHAIPSSGEKLTVVGIGTRDFGTNFDPAARTALKEMLQHFPELGGQVIDTAPSYRNAEQILGELAAETAVRPKLFLADKVNAGRAANVAAEISSQFETGLARLRTKTLDLVQIHNLAAVAESLPLLREWKQAGRVRYIGITTSDTGQFAQMASIMRAQSLDFIQVDYAINSREAATEILPLARDRGMAVLVNLPFGRRTAFEKTGAHPVPDWAKDIDCTTWAQVFLKYVVSHPAVTAAIPGTRSLEHAKDNMAAAHGRLPDAAFRTRIERTFDSL
jgi:aryl-alcohol dehydrogenase-like predicted oxidoreductase